MAQKIKMSLQEYERIKEKLIPKHMAFNEQQRKKKNIRKQMLEQSPGELLQKLKLKYMKPIGEIETIMNHFDAKFDNKKVRSVQKSSKFSHQRKGSSRYSDEEQLCNRMNYLINLPSLKTLRKEAARYKGMMFSDEIKRKEEKKAQIMQNFQRYMQAQMTSRPPALRQRMKTIQ